MVEICHRQRPRCVYPAILLPLMSRRPQGLGGGRLGGGGQQPYGNGLVYPECSGFNMTRVNCHHQIIVDRSIAQRIFVSYRMAKICVECQSYGQKCTYPSYIMNCTVPIGLHFYNISYEIRTQAVLCCVLLYSDDRFTHILQGSSTGSIRSHHCQWKNPGEWG